MPAGTLLSIVTITRGDPEGLEQTLRSLLQLEGRSLSWELVLIDSSPEESGAAIERYRSALPLRHVTQEPRGIYPAFNLGLSQAAGEVLWFLNGGDCLADAAVLEKFLTRMQARPRLMLLCGSADRVKEGRLLHRWLPGSSFYWSLMGAPHLCSQGMLYRAALFRELGPFSERFPRSGDYEHCLRCLAAGIEVELVPDCLARFDASGVSSREYLAGIFETWRIIVARAGGFGFRTNCIQQLFWLRHAAWVLFAKLLGVSPVGPTARRLWHARLVRREKLLRTKDGDLGAGPQVGPPGP